FSISTRHWLPIKELERAIFTFADPPDGLSVDEPPQAVEINSTAAAAAISRTVRCTLIALHLVSSPRATPEARWFDRGGNRGQTDPQACGHGGQSLQGSGRLCAAMSSQR